MSTDPVDPDQAARLARLHQRRGGVAAPAAAAPVAEPTATTIDKHTNVAVRSTKRRHAAAAGRVLATGLATSGFLGTITALAQSDMHKDADAASNPSTQPSVVTKTIQHVIYVDQNGNPVAPPSSSIPGDTVPGVVDSVPGVPTATTLPGTPGAPGTPVGPGTPQTPGAPVTTAKPGTPVTTAKPGTPAPVTTQGQAPVTTKAPAPATTQAPAPVTTKAPPPPTTQAPAPPTTKAPACTGSKCP